MKDSVLDLLGTSLIPKLCSYIAAGTAGNIKLILIFVAAVRAAPNELALFFNDFDFAVISANLAIIALCVELGIHDMIVNILHNG